MRGPLVRMARLAAPVWQWIALSVLLGFMTVISSMGLMGAAAFIIASAAFHPPLVDLQLAIVGVRFFGIARAVSRYGERLASHETTFRLLAKIRVWFYSALEPLAPARLLRLRSGDVLARAVTDVEELESLFVRVLAPPLVAVTVTLATAVFIGWFDPRLALLTVSCMTVVGLVLPILTRIASRAPGRRLAAARRTLTLEIVDGTQGMAELTAAGRASDRLGRMHRASAELARAEIDAATIGGFESGFTTLVSHLAVWGLILAAIPAIASGRLDGITVAVLSLVVMAAFEAVQPIAASAQGMERQSVSAHRLWEILDASPAVSDPTRPKALGRPSTPPGLAVDGVRFAYAPGDALALNRVTVRIQPGSRVAVVGPSGAGKSTLVHLLLRFWDPDEGVLRIDGHDLRDLTQDELRQTFGVVSQRTDLLAGTLAEALRIACPEADDHQLWAALDTARLAEAVSQLPDGLETWIGEHGLLLSEGQRQRLAIARTVLADPPVLVLDEPTANLDTVTASEVMASLIGLMHDRTALLITHRLADAARMDEIVVLDRGRMVEHGRHDELLARGGLYHRMWTIQRQTLD